MPTRPSIAGSYETLFLLRWLRACHRLRPPASCRYPVTEVETVARNFIAVQLKYFDDWGSWQNQGTPRPPAGQRAGLYLLPACAPISFATYHRHRASGLSLGVLAGVSVR